MKISADKKFAMFERINNQTNEKWIEILNLTKISSIQERRCVYNNQPGKRYGYLVFVDGGDKNGFWINDSELQVLLNEGIFGEFLENFNYNH